MYLQRDMHGQKVLHELYIYVKMKQGEFQKQISNATHKLFYRKPV